MSIDTHGCYAYLQNDFWIVGNNHIERRWLVRDGQLYATSLIDKSSGREWLEPCAHPSLVGRVVHSTGVVPTATTRMDADHPVSAASFVAELSSPALRGADVRRFRVFPDGRSVTMQLITPTEESVAAQTKEAHASDVPTGAEAADEKKRAARPTVDLLECLKLRTGHHRLTQVELRDQTDAYGNLAFEKTFYLDSSEREVRLRGVLFFIEDVLTGDGLILLKHAPLPHARPVRDTHDLDVRDTFDVALLGHGTRDGGEGYPFALIAFRGGAAGRIAALHDYQRQFRPYNAGRDGLLLSNTWGDRSQDGRVSEVFMNKEIDAAARLGVDVVQIDDGWQGGKTSNSVNPTGGVWEGYWDVSQEFWKPHAERFPKGLQPLLAQAREHGLGFGLWYSPDSSNDFAHWQDDARTLVNFYRTFGVTHVKIDGVKATTKRAERKLFQLFDTALRESAGALTFDLDVTAQIRPGYFALPQIGPLFVENRYTDMMARRYFPHHTLRTLWTLAPYIIPVRLRMEFLNNARNEHNYPNDPLAPARYRADTLFAIVMFASPLGWFETSRLSERYLAEAAPLIKTWKAHRSEMQRGQILPVGGVPDGVNWTGFVSVGVDAAHVLFFRELNSRDDHTFDLPHLPEGFTYVDMLGGAGTVTREGTEVRVRGVEQLGYVWCRLTRA